MNRLFFYLKAFLPLCIIIFIFLEEYTILGSILILLYSFIYRPLIDYQRLREKGVVLPFGKLYLPLVRLKYFKMLYL